MMTGQKADKYSIDTKAHKLKNQKIIFVFGNLEMGGAERQGLHLARFLQKECGAKVLVLGLQATPGRLSQECDRSQIAWHGIDLQWPIQSYRLCRKISALKHLAQFLRQQQPDILMPYTYLPNIACGLIWKYTGARLCIWNQRDEGRFLTRWPLHRLAVSATPFFLSNSDNSKRFLQGFYGLSEDKIAVVHNGVSLPQPLADKKTWRKRLRTQENSFIVCMLANIHGHKDHATVLKAWRLFLDNTNESGIPSILCFAGRVDVGGEQLKEIAEMLSIAGTVRFMGSVDDVSGLLHAVDLLVHSSMSEGLPNAVLEAMTAGLPVVATDIPGNREALGPEGRRFLAPPGDPEKMANLIKQFFCDPVLKETHGRKLQKRARTEFDISQMCTATVSLIENVIDNKPDKGIRARQP